MVTAAGWRVTLLLAHAAAVAAAQLREENKRLKEQVERLEYRVKHLAANVIELTGGVATAAGRG